MGPAPPPPTTTTSHPTGYQQNLFAQELSPAQRASLDQQEETERRGSFFAGLPGGNVGAGAGGSASEGGDTAGNVWNTVKGWASAAGSKAAEVEADVWRRYGGK